MKKILSVFLVSIIIFCSSFITLTASADSKLGFEIDCSMADSRLTVTVSADRTVSGIIGFYSKIKVPENVKYVSGSRKILFNADDNTDITKDTLRNGALVLGVDALEADTFKFDKKIVSYQFEVTSQVGSADFILEIEEIYKKSQKRLEDIPLSSQIFSKSVPLSGGSSANVENVIGLINAIGNVTVSSGEAIAAAREAYNVLDISDKRKVSNADILFEAEIEFAKITAESDKSRLNALADEFRRTHSEILSRSNSTLKLSDKQILESALEDYANEELNVRILLIEEKNHLNRLKTRLKELEDIENKRITEEKLKNEAKQLAEEWKQRYKDFIALDKSKVTDQYLTGLVNAIGDADSQTIINSYFLDYVSDEYNYLKELYEIARKYSGSSTSEFQKMADEFASAYSYLMYLNKGDVIADDEVDIKTALSLYQMLPKEVVKILDTFFGEGKFETKLNELLSAVEALPSDSAGDRRNGDSDNNDDSGKSDNSSDKTVKSEDEKKSGILVNIKSSGVGKIVWGLLFSSVFIVILLFAALIGFVLIKRKYKNLLNEGGELSE